jgi:hydroxymethylpyrimidine pyrophosphatase-like HAD family hydrolase
MIKLLATDLDGTLLYPKYNILDLPRKNKRFLKQFIASGGQVVIASGRGINLLPKLERSVGSKMALLGCNGAFLYKDGVFHTSHPLNNSDALELFTNCYFNYSILFWFLFDQTNKMYLYCGDRSFVKNITAFGNLFLGIRRERAIFDKKVFLSKFDGDTVYKLTVSFGLGKYSYQAAQESYFAFMERFSDKFSIALSNNGIEFTAPGCEQGERPSGIYEDAWNQAGGSSCLRRLRERYPDVRHLPSFLLHGARCKGSPEACLPYREGSL